MYTYINKLNKNKNKINIFNFHKCNISLCDKYFTSYKTRTIAAAATIFNPNLKKNKVLVYIYPLEKHFIILYIMFIVGIPIYIFNHNI